MSNWLPTRAAHATFVEQRRIAFLALVQANRFQFGHVPIDPLDEAWVAVLAHHPRRACAEVGTYVLLLDKRKPARAVMCRYVVLLSFEHVTVVIFTARKRTCQNESVMFRENRIWSWECGKQEYNIWYAGFKLCFFYAFLSQWTNTP